ncbi:MAG: hypothetical protein RIS64_974 [Bacteroidota bacterium]|jgi:hypothetical protein
MKELQIILMLIGQSIFLPAQCLSGDCVNGHGTYHSVKRGWKYAGQFKNGKPDGKGKMIFNDGRYYEGEFMNGKFHGTGTMKLDENVQIKGAWRDGYSVNNTSTKPITALSQAHSSDTFIRAQCLNGDCVNGIGTYHSIKQGWKYTGQFKNGQPNGHGKMIFKHGRYYEGAFLQGKLHGKGAMYFDGTMEINGTWDHGKLVEDLTTVPVKKIVPVKK